MTLEFDREVIRLDGYLVTGTVSVEDDGEGLETVAFKPEDGRTLTWGEVWLACDEWLVTNKPRVLRAFARAFKHL